MPLTLSRPRWGRLEVAGPGLPRAAVLEPADLEQHASAPVPPPAMRPADVVLVHGLGCSHRYFGPLATTLAQRGHTVAAPDLPGFGLTPPAAGRRVPGVSGHAAVLIRWLVATGRTEAVLVANSFGAQVVVELAARRPDLAGGLVLIGPSLDRSRPTLRQQAARLVRNTVNEPPRVAAMLGRDYLVCGVRRYVMTARAALSHPVEERAAGLAAAVAVVRGERDPLSSPAWALGLARAAGGTYLEVPEAAHLVHWSHPEAVADVVARMGTGRRLRVPTGRSEAGDLRR